MEEFMIPCLSKKFFGIDCFGCGIQRAIVLLFKGEFKGAFYIYPAIYPMLFFGGFLALSFIDKSRNYHKIIVTFGVVTSLIMVVYYFYKLLNF